MATRACTVDANAQAKSITVGAANTYNLNFSSGVTLDVTDDVVWAGSGRFDQGTNSGNVAIGGSVTLTAGSWTKNANTVLTVGVDLNMSAGTFTGASGTISVGRDLTVTSTGSYSNGNALLKVARNLTASGTAFTASSGVTRVGGRFNHSAGTYNDNNGNILFNATTNQTHTFGGAIFKRATFNDGMVGYWNMDDGSFGGSTPADASGYLNAGVSNSVTRSTSGCASLAFFNPSCAAFDGSSSYVEPTVNQFPATNAAQSISAWMKANTAATATIVGMTGTSAALRLGITATLLQVSRNDGTVLISTSLPSTGAWHHVAYTWDGSNNRLYVDGTAVTPTATGHDVAAVSHVIFGATTAGSGFYDGALDDLRIYDRVLTAQEVNTLSLGRTPGTSIATHTLSDAYTANVGSNVADFVIASGTVTGSQTITIEGSWLNYGGRFTGTGTVRITSAGGESILSGGSAFSAFTIATSDGSGVNVLRDRLWIPNGPLTITSGRLSTGGYNIHAGSIAMASSGSTFTASTGTVIYDSSTDTTLPNQVLTTYYKLRIEDPSETNLVGYWKFDEGSGTGGSSTRDWSGNGNHGTLSASGAHWATAPATMEFDNASAMNFDGGTVAVGTSNLPGANASQTISAWINITAMPASTSGIVSISQASGNILLGLSTTELGVRRSDGTQIVGTTAPSTGSWHHVAYTWDGTTNVLYIDGIAQPATNTAHDATGAVTSALIGATSLTTGFFNGQIDDVRIYDAALTATQVARLNAGRYAGTGGYSTTTLAANTTVNNTFAIDAGNVASSSYTFAAALTSAEATINAGSFNVGTTTNTFSGGLNVRDGATLALTAAGGLLRIANNRTLTMDGILSANQPTATIRNAGSGRYAFKIGSSAGATPTVNVTGLAVQNVDSNGLWINANAGATTTFTNFNNIAFSNGAAAGNLLQIYAPALNLVSNGCSFDASTTYTVKLAGDGFSAGAEFTQTRALFGGATCSAGSCQATKSDDDPNNDGVPTAASGGAVLLFLANAATDTAGTIEGFPTAAFSWNTGAWYSTYVAFHDTSGTVDTVYVRDTAGAARYAWSTASSEHIVGTPRWTTEGTGVNEKHYLYVALASGKVYRLLDDGASLAPDTESTGWSSGNPYDCACTITTGVVLDSTNLYWAGQRTSDSTYRIWGIGQANKSVPGWSPMRPSSVSSPVTGETAVTTATPAVWFSGATTYTFIGQTGYIVKADVSTGTVAEYNSNPGSGKSILGRIVVLNWSGTSRVLAGDDGGSFWSIAPGTFTGTNKQWGYTALAGIDQFKTAPIYDYSGGYVHFGSEGGRLIVLNGTTGAALAGYPMTSLTTDPMRMALFYRSGVVAVGTTTGKLFFVNRRTTAGGTPVLMREYYFGSTQQVSGIAYDSNSNKFMVTTSAAGSTDGRFYMIDASEATLTDSDGIL
jgi:hypothetical protein